MRTAQGCCCVAWLAAGLAAQAPIQFVDATPSIFPLSFAERAIAADFDGDADTDLCIGRTAITPLPSSQWLLRNDGGGRLPEVSATQLVSDSSFTRQLAAIDIEGDGDLDLFLAKVGAGRLWRNDGSGFFSDASAGLPMVSLGATGVAVADFDGDGDDDVAIGGFLTLGSQNRMLVNDGTGVFTSLDPFPGALTRALAAADVDGDGDDDLLLNETGGVRLLRNDGAMAFVDVSAQQLPTLPPTAIAVAFGDLDADADEDIVITYSFPRAVQRWQRLVRAVPERVAAGCG